MSEPYKRSIGTCLQLITASLDFYRMNPSHGRLATARYIYLLATEQAAPTEEELTKSDDVDKFIDDMFEIEREKDLSAAFAFQKIFETSSILALSGTVSLYTERTQDFVQNTFTYPDWEPDTTRWSETACAHIASLHIPPTDHEFPSIPDLIMYGVGRLNIFDASFDTRLADFVSGVCHLHLVQASGSGKTRLAIETLFHHMGFYMSAVVGTSDPYGSCDLSSAVDYLDRAHIHFTIPNTRPKRVPIVEHNRSCVSKIFRRLLLARFLVFDHFIRLATKHSLPDADMRLKWLWLQIRPHAMIDCDVFDEVFQELSSWKDADVSILLGHFVEKHSPRLRFVVIDEAQSLCNVYPVAFTTDDYRHFRPALRELIQVIGNTWPDVRIIVSGTEVPFSLTSEAISTLKSTSKSRGVRHFKDLGGFFDSNHSESYLKHFLGAEFTDANCSLAHRWFRGRHRMMTAVVRQTLSHGASRFPWVLDAMIENTTGFRGLVDSSTPVGLMVNIRQVAPDDYIEDSPVAPLLRSAVYTYVACGKPAIFKSQVEELVGTGLARFCAGATGSATVDEPPMLLNIVRWLQTSPKFSTARILRQRHLEDVFSIHGLSLPEAVAINLWQRFSSRGLNLDRIASFPVSSPPWASRPAHFCSTAIESPRIFLASQAPLVRRAENVDDVVAWLKNSDTPFLVPDATLGAQLIFALDSGPRPRVVFLYLDPFTRSKPRRNRRVIPRNPREFYSQDRSSQLKFRDALPLLEDESSTLQTLQLYCFAEAYHPDSIYSPPVAFAIFSPLLSSSVMDELSQNDLLFL